MEKRKGVPINRMKRKTSFILIAIFLLANTVSAFEYAKPFRVEQSAFSKFFSKILECKWRISCYNKFGAFTDLNSTDLQIDFPTLYNAHLDQSIEVGTTSIASITTLNSLTTATALASVGTITTGTWTGSVIDVARQGTGSTSPSRYQVVLGDGSRGFTVASSTGTSGQFLTSNGSNAYPSWQTSSVDQAGTYNWTGPHSFASATTTFNATTSVQTMFNVATTSGLSLAGANFGTSTYFAKGVSIGKATSTSSAILEVTGNTILANASTSVLIVDSCIGCTAYTGSSTSYSVTSGTITYTGSIPTNANFGIISLAMNDDQDFETNIYIARKGLTQPTFTYQHSSTAGATKDYTATYTWSEADFSVQENLDTDTDGSISGTAYWYR